MTKLSLLLPTLRRFCTMKSIIQNPRGKSCNSWTISKFHRSYGAGPGERCEASGASPDGRQYLLQEGTYRRRHRRLHWGFPPIQPPFFFSLPLFHAKEIDSRMDFGLVIVIECLDWDFYLILCFCNRIVVKMEVFLSFFLSLLSGDLCVDLGFCRLLRCAQMWRCTGRTERFAIGSASSWNCNGFVVLFWIGFEVIF